MELTKLKIQNMKERKEKKGILEKEQTGLKGRIGEINAKKIELSKEINDVKNVEEDYKIVRTQLDIALENEKKLDVNKTGLEKEIESLNRIAKNLDEEVNEKLIVKKIKLSC